MRHVTPVLLGVLLVAGCFFDRAGLPVDELDRSTARKDVAATERHPDRSIVEDRSMTDRADLPSADRASTEAQVADQSPLHEVAVVVPVGAAALGQAFFSTQVPCVDKAGLATGGQTKVADSASLQFFDGAVTLNGAAPNTLAWVGGKPAVTVMFDINACDDEAPSGSSSWSSAGLLVRGATLVSGDLMLSTGSTVNDINLVDVNTNGTWQGEFVEPDDSLLHTYPQLVNPTNKAKELLIKLAGL